MGKQKRAPENADKSATEKTSNVSNFQSTDDTIFLRNLSFDTEEETLKQFIEESFGPTVYCLICRDKDTDESKGTAFAKFKDPEDAKKCMKESRDRELMTKFHLDGRNLIVLPAISRDKISQVKNKEDVKKDKRNLELAKEGRIHSLSEEAKDMSKSDNEKRKVLDKRKKELLNNLHNFVSDTRLCIHNLPSSVEDQRLRKIFIDSVNGKYPEAKIMECRVMRNKKGSGQLGTSKGFGFVAFSKHEHALAALRNLNNNPEIFTKDRRPIVEFSIENLVALNKKKTRLVNSQRKNLATKTGENKDKTPSKVKPKNSAKMNAKKMKRKSTVTVKNLDASQQNDILMKIKKVKQEKKRNKVP